ncbi:GntR family transcriptional regulator [Lysinibacillus sp. NPDC093190]
MEEIQAGEKLPSERVLSERLGVGRSSVREAL